MKVMYWSDYACPYCYIGKTHLKKAIENLDPGDQIDVEEGMDEGEVQQLLESDQYADDVRLDEREAQRYGVQGVPYFVVGNKYAIPGALPVESMERVLKNVLGEEAKAAESAVQGMACGPDGCHFEG